MDGEGNGELLSPITVDTKSNWRYNNHMKRTIITSEAALVALLNSEMSKVGIPCENIENYLGIEFAYTDGTFCSILKANADENSDWPWEEMDIDRTVYQKTEDTILPTSYPVLMLYSITKDFDRLGTVRTCQVEFITKEDVSPMLDG